MRKIPPLSAIRVFEAAARHEHFTAAAEELGMTQAAVSYQIRALEDRVGVKLFDRAKGRVQLTDSGRRLLAPLSDAFDRMDSAFATLRADDEHMLSISTTPTFANTWLAWRLGGFQMDHPQLAVRLDATAKLVDFAHEEVDVAIRAGMGDWPGLHTVKLFDIDYTPVCSPRFLEQWKAEHDGRKMEPADLIDLPQVSSNDPWLHQWLKEVGVEIPDDLPVRPGIQLELPDRRRDRRHGGKGDRDAHALLLALGPDRGEAGPAVQADELARLGLLAGLPRAPPQRARRSNGCANGSCRRRGPTMRRRRPPG